MLLEATIGGIVFAAFIVLLSVAAFNMGRNVGAQSVPCPTCKMKYETHEQRGIYRPCRDIPPPRKPPQGGSGTGKPLPRNDPVASTATFTPPQPGKGTFNIDNCKVGQVTDGGNNYLFDEKGKP